MLRRMFGVRREEYYCSGLQTTQVRCGMTYCMADIEIYTEEGTAASLIGPAQTIWPTQDSQRTGVSEANAGCKRLTHILSRKAPHRTSHTID
jgi:hypothetical protein